MAEKITMKIDETVHRKLQVAKGLLGVKTFGEAIQVLAEEYIEKHIGKKK